MRKSLMAIGFSVLLAGCASMKDVMAEHDKGGGTTKVYDASSVDQVWDASRAALRWEDCEAIEEHRGEGYMVTSVGRGVLDAGTVVGVWIDQQGAAVRVNVVTKRKQQTSIATGLTEDTLQRDIAKAIAIVKSGQPLPATAPKS